MGLGVQVDDRVFRKIGFRILPFLAICYIAAIVDRFNLGFAKLQFAKDLNIGEDAFGLAAGLFYASYVLLEVPSNYFLTRVGIRITLVRIMVIWGAITVAFAFATRAVDLYVLRFLLGAAEAGFFPGILFYLTLWFPDSMRGRMSSLFVMAVPIGGIIAGPLSGLIMDRFEGLAGFHGWQWLFVIEGVPTIVLGLTAYRTLANDPQQAGWLTDAEKRFVAQRVERDGGSRSPERRFLDAFKSGRVYLLAAIYFAYYSSLNVLLTWTPTLLKRVGNGTSTEIGIRSGIISLMAAIGMYLIGRNSDRMRERRWHIALCGLTASGSMFLLPLGSENIEVTMLLLTSASVTTFSILSLFWTIPSSYLSGAAVAAGIALIGAIGTSAGAFASAFVGWMITQTGSAYMAFTVVGIANTLGMLLLVLFVPKQRADTPEITMSPTPMSADADGTSEVGVARLHN